MTFCMVCSNHLKTSLEKIPDKSREGWSHKSHKLRSVYVWRHVHASVNIVYLTMYIYMYVRIVCYASSLMCSSFEMF